MPEAPIPRIPQPRPRAGTLGRLASMVGHNPGRRFEIAGDAARDRRDWPVAIAAYEQSLQRAPWRAPVWVQYGHALKESGDGANAEHSRSERHALRVIARRGAHDAAVALLLREPGELHERAADLVRARALEELGLEPHLEPGLFAERPRAQERRAVDVRRDQGQRGSRIGRRRHGHFRAERTRRRAARATEAR